MNATEPNLGPALKIVSRIGNRVLHFDPDRLQVLLADLRSERQRHDISVETDNAEGEHNALMQQAEAVKQRATEAIARS
jgi:hypothetical protein